MRLVVKKSDSVGLHDCCNRQPIVGAYLDFADEYEPAFDIYCPVCERCVVDTSFIEARKTWNHNIMAETPYPPNYLIPED